MKLVLSINNKVFWVAKAKMEKKVSGRLYLMPRNKDCDVVNFNKKTRKTPGDNTLVI